MALWFAEQGLAALTYDKRGVGESSGDFRQVPFMDLAGDGLAAVTLLKARSDIDPRRIGVWGLSQSGWLGPLAASQSREVAFVIAVSGPGVSPGKQMIFYYGSQLRNQGLSEAAISAAGEVHRKVWHYLATDKGYREAALTQARAQPWFKDLQSQQDSLFRKSDSEILDGTELRSSLWFRVELNYDPMTALRKLSAPALFLFGEKDELVPVTKSVEIIRAAFSESPSHDFTINVFPGADHGMYVMSADGTTNYAPGYSDFLIETGALIKKKRLIAEILDGQLVCPKCKGKSADVFTFYEMSIIQTRKVGRLRGTTLLVEDDYDTCDVRTDFDQDRHLECYKCGLRVEIPEEIEVDFTPEYFDEEAHG